MQLKKIGFGVFVVIIGAAIGWKLWQKQLADSEQIVTQIDGSAVILFRGDNSPGCRAIHNLVDQAAVRYGEKIRFVQLDWSADNPLIKKYQIRFLPTVVFVNQQNKEAARIIGESEAVQLKLGRALASIEDLLR